MSRLRRALRGGLVALTSLSLAGAAAAVESTVTSGPVTASVRLSPESPVIGDPIRLEIEAIAEPDVEVLMPDFGEALDRFSILNFVPREGLDDRGYTVWTQTYTLQVPLSGPHTLPSILIEFIDRRPGHDPAPEGMDAYELLTEALSFEVESVVLDASDDTLAPPAGELGPRRTGVRNPWLWAGAVVVALLAAAPFALRAVANLRARSLRRSAYEVARAELDALLAAPRPEPEAVSAFFVKLSGIVRVYLENRFQLRSPELTTEEFIHELSSSPDLVRSHQDLLRDFLQQADLVKFAHHIPAPEDVDEALAAASRFLDETREAGAGGGATSSQSPKPPAGDAVASPAD